MLDQETIITSLLKEFKEQREALVKMIKDLEELKDRIYRLFPEQLDKRYVRFFEEKVKAATGLFNALLDIRKEINKSLKDEIDLRRKIEGKDDEEIEKILNIRAIAEKVEKMQKEQLETGVSVEGFKEPEEKPNDNEATSDMH